MFCCQLQSVSVFSISWSYLRTVFITKLSEAALVITSLWFVTNRYQYCSDIDIDGPDGSCHCVFVGFHCFDCDFAIHFFTSNWVDFRSHRAKLRQIKESCLVYAVFREQTCYYFSC